MGTWGPGLYQNDTAADIRSDFKLWVGMPWTPARLVEELAKEYQIPLDGTCDADDHTAFWLVLADQFHAYGLDHGDVFRTARRVIEDGTDIRILRELEMSEADLRRRAKSLDALTAKWRDPPAKIRKIKPLKQEPLVLAEGDVVAYPAMNFCARQDPVLAHNPDTYRFEPDAMNVFVVLATEHVFHGMFARYFIAPLLLFGGDDPPALKDTMICFFICETHIAFRAFNPVGGWAEIRKKDLAFIDAQKIGSVDLNHERIAEHFPDLEERRGQMSYAGLGFLQIEWSPWSDMVRGSAWNRFGEIDDFASFLAGRPVGDAGVPEG